MSDWCSLNLVYAAGLDQPLHFSLACAPSRHVSTSLSWASHTFFAAPSQSQSLSMVHTPISAPRPDWHLHFHGPALPCTFQTCQHFALAGTPFTPSLLPLHVAVPRPALHINLHLSVQPLLPISAVSLGSRWVFGPHIFAFFSSFSSQIPPSTSFLDLHSFCSLSSPLSPLCCVFRQALKT